MWLRKEIKPSIVSQQCVVCKFACDIMLTKQPDSFNALPNTSIQLSVNICLRPSLNTQSDSDTAKLFV